MASWPGDASPETPVSLRKPAALAVATSTTTLCRAGEAPSGNASAPGAEDSGLLCPEAQSSAFFLPPFSRGRAGISFNPSPGESDEGLLRVKTIMRP